VGFNPKKITDNKSIFYSIASIGSISRYVGMIGDRLHMLPKPGEKDFLKKLKLFTFFWQIFQNAIISSPKLFERRGIRKITFGASDSIIYDLMSEILEPDEVYRPKGANYPGSALANLYRFDLGEEKYVYWSIYTHDQNIKSVHVTSGVNKDIIISFLWKRLGKVIQLDTSNDDIGYVRTELHQKKIYGSSTEMISKLKKDYDHFYDNKMSRGYLLIGKPGTGKTGIVNAIVSEAKGRVFVISGLGSVSMIESIESLSTHMEPDFIIFDDCDRSASTSPYVRAILKLIESVKEKNPHTMFLFTANTFDGILSDDAVTRKGRIDQIYEIPEPGLEDRKEIITRYAEEFGVKLSDEDLDKCIQESDGMTGADLKELCIQLQRASIDECFEQNQLIETLKEKYKPDLFGKLNAYNDDDIMDIGTTRRRM